MVKPFIIGTRNAGEFLIGGVKVLREGGSALDAVEAATRLVELNPKDTSVGLAGIPNILGVQEMDATIMCGKTMNSGAVGALQGYKHPISVARKVLDEAPHVLLVGEGAALFAKAMGCEPGDLETDLSRMVYQAFVDDAFDDEEVIDESQKWVVNYARSQNLRAWYDKLKDEQHGTVNILAMDENGDIASAVSTSGTALKFPGRLGDSPIIGAGTWADNRTCAVSSTGQGEFFIRNAVAHEISALMMHAGLDLREAADSVVQGALVRQDALGGIIAVDHEGNYCFSFNTNSMYRGVLVEGGETQVKIFGD